MKRFALNISVFLIGLLIFNYFLYIKVFEIYLEPYLIFDNPKGVKTFLLADSHGQAMGENLSSIGIVNFAANSDSYLDMERKLEHLLSNHEVERILLIADGHTLSNYRHKSNNLDRSIQFVKNSKKDPVVKNRFKFFWKKYVSGYIVPINEKSSSIVRSYAESLFTKNNQSIKKIVSNKVRKYDTEKMALKLERRSLKQYGPSKSDKLADSLERIIATCKEQKIELIGLRFPITQDYYEVVKDQDFGAKQLMESKRVLVLDFINVFSDHNEFFKDQDHLNKNGSLELAKLIRENENFN